MIKENNEQNERIEESFIDDISTEDNQNGNSYSGDEAAIETNENNSRDLQEPNRQSESPEAFPSASLLLECAKDEYNKEHERLYSLDNKASFFMSAIILVATIFIPFVPFGKIRGIMSYGSDLQKAVTYITATLIAVALVFLITAFKHLYDAYKIKAFDRFNIENLSDISIMTADRNCSEKGLCENYKNTIAKNIEKNDKKADQISRGIKYSAIGFLLLTISAIFMVCFIG